MSETWGVVLAVGLTIGISLVLAYVFWGKWWRR